MTIRIGINGFGRIGRDYLRYVLDGAGDGGLEVVAINDVTDAATMCRLLRYDSTFGPLRHKVDELDDSMVIEGHKIALTSERDPAALRWRDYDVQVVIEASGRFKTRDAAAAHMVGGAS